MRVNSFIFEIWAKLVFLGGEGKGFWARTDLIWLHALLAEIKLVGSSQGSENGRWRVREDCGRDIGNSF